MVLGEQERSVAGSRSDEDLLDGGGDLAQKERTRTVVGGTRWQSAAQLGVQLIRVVVTLILARLLTTSDFGIVAYALTFVMFVDSFKHLGAITAIIQRPTISQRLVTSLFYMNVLIGGTLGVLFALSSPWLVSSSGSDENPWVLAPMGLVTLVSSMGVVHRGLLFRRLQFRRVAVMNLTPTVVFGTVAIALAANGWGASAIVVGQVAGSIGGVAIGFVMTRWRPSLVFDWGEVKSVLGVIGHMMGFGIFNYLFQNADKFLVGSVLGAAALGVYSIGQRVLMYPVRSMTQTIGQVLFPTFARIRDDDAAIRRGFLRACGAISLLTFPMMIGVSVLSPQFVRVVLGEKWEEAIPIITILAPIGLLHAIHYTVGSIYQAKARFGALMWWGVGSGLFTFAAYIAGLPWGILGVTVSYAIAVLILTYPTFAIPFRFIDLRFVELVRTVGPTLLASGVMGAIVLAYRLTLERQGSSDALIFFTAVPIGVAVYGIWLVMSRPPAMAEYFRIVGLKGLAKWWTPQPSPA